MRSDSDFASHCEQSVLFQAKLEAFAYLILNMFEVVLAEAPTPERKGRRTESAVWVDFFKHAISKSSIVRGILEIPHSMQVYSHVLTDLYADWQKSEAGVVDAWSC